MNLAGGEQKVIASDTSSYISRRKPPVYQFFAQVWNHFISRSDFGWECFHSANSIKHCVSDTDLIQRLQFESSHNVQSNDSPSTIKCAINIVLLSSWHVYIPSLLAFKTVKFNSVVSPWLRELRLYWPLYKSYTLEFWAIGLSLSSVVPANHIVCDASLTLQKKEALPPLAIVVRVVLDTSGKRTKDSYDSDYFAREFWTLTHPNIFATWETIQFMMCRPQVL